MAAIARSMICARVSTPVVTRQLKQTPAKTFAKVALAKRATVSARTALNVRSEGFEGMSWYPGAEGPAYLDGTMPGDYGFDPLRIGSNPTLLPYFKEAELMNGRWAMMAVTGIMFTDALGLPKFWEAGAAAGAIGPMGLGGLIAFEVAIFAFLESKRIEGFKKTGCSGFLNDFPFDPMGMDTPVLRVKEVKNARLAMVAFLGFCSEAAVTGMGPIEGLKAHIADPSNVNIYTSAVGGEVVCAIVALSVAPFIIETTKSLGDGSEDFRPIPW